MDIKINFRYISYGNVKWTQLAQNMVQKQTSDNMVVNLMISYKQKMS
jgi:hypothetical protein